jgi:dynein heavy chain 1
VVEQKLSRSKTLLFNLSSEKMRWSESSNNFKSQIENLIGDVLISSAFLTYIGFFDFFYRKVLDEAWRGMLVKKNIAFRGDISNIEFLSTPSERLSWKGHKLPADDLCTENAIILNRYLKYPLLIDPSGQAQEFISSLLSSQKLSKSSFADEAFLKTLKTAIQFGCPLIVQDVEKVDPILNSVLNKEVYQTGGRVLIRVGDQEIDYNQDFCMYMVTRDSQARFTPDLCSRVTFINFTTTPSSLQDQCLNIFLKNERPDTEERRIQLMKLQGEYVVKLRELEKNLLDAINNAEGSILDSEVVISKLEKLKTEASRVNDEMEKSNEVLAEVESVTGSYLRLAQTASRIFFAILGLGSVHYLYQYSLNFYMNLVYKILREEPLLASEKDPERRKQVIEDSLYKLAFTKVSASVLARDQIVLGMRFLQLKVTGPLIGLLLRESPVPGHSLPPSLLQGALPDSQLRQLQAVLAHPAFRDLLSELQASEPRWLAFLASAQPETDIPPFKTECAGLDLQIAQCILIKILRPDRFEFAVNTLIKKVLGVNSEMLTVDLAEIISETKSKEPIILSSAPGFDPSFKIESIALDGKLKSVALGSAEGFDQADKAINECSKSGGWVLLKNVHLATAWLSELEKKIHRMEPNKTFRLFLTSEFSPKIPSTLLRQSVKLVF